MRHSCATNDNPMCLYSSVSRRDTHLSRRLPKKPEPLHAAPHACSSSQSPKIRESEPWDMAATGKSRHRYAAAHRPTSKHAHGALGSRFQNFLPRTAAKSPHATASTVHTRPPPASSRIRSEREEAQRRGKTSVGPCTSDSLVRRHWRRLERGRVGAHVDAPLLQVLLREVGRPERCAGGAGARVGVPV